MSRRRFAGLALLALLSIGPAAAPAAAPAAWVDRSNENAPVLLEVMASYSPEGAGQLGVPGIDEQIFDLKPGFVERRLEALGHALAELRGRLAAEKDPAVQQDLEILIQAAEDQWRAPSSSASSCSRTSASRTRCTRACARCSTTRSRRAPRRRRWCGCASTPGLEPGYQPIAKLAEARIRERMTVAGADRAR